MIPLLLALVAGAAEVGPTEHAVLRIEGMTCAGCERNVAGKLQAVDGVQRVTAAFAEAGACVDVGRPLDTDLLKTAVEAAGYAVTAVEVVAECPTGLKPGRKPGPWAKIEEEVDVRVISHGEKVKLAAHAVPGKYTVYDFGAAWCGPCHVAARKLAAYLSDHPDVAARVVDLDAADARASFALPAAKQHLRFAPGLPWLIVRAPDGGTLYEGQDPDAAVAAIEEHRKK